MDFWKINTFNKKLFKFHINVIVIFLRFLPAERIIEKYTKKPFSSNRQKRRYLCFELFFFFY